jgi:hypothetical protein
VETPGPGHLVGRGSADGQQVAARQGDDRPHDVAGLGRHLLRAERRGRGGGGAEAGTGLGVGDVADGGSVRPDTTAVPSALAAITSSPAPGSAL